MNFEVVDEKIYSVRMREKFNNFTIISVSTPTEKKHALVKESFYGKLNHIYQIILPHDTKTIVGVFTAKI